MEENQHTRFSHRKKVGANVAWTVLHMCETLEICLAFDDQVFGSLFLAHLLHGPMFLVVLSVQKGVVFLN